MERYTALAVAVPRQLREPRVEVVAQAASLAALAARVRRREPSATLRLFDGPVAVLVDGRPLRGLGRVPGRVIYLCGPPLVAAAAPAAD